MKELTSVLTLQFTYIRKYDDEKADVAVQVQKDAADRWVKALKEMTEADDIQLLGNKVFVHDMEG